MKSIQAKSSVKVVGANGQISLGKEFAGKKVLVEEREPGVWLIRTARVIPENELWLHESAASHDLQRALTWAQQNSPGESAPEEVARKLEHARKKTKSRSARS